MTSDIQTVSLLTRSEPLGYLGSRLAGGFRLIIFPQNLRLIGPFTKPAIVCKI